MLKPIYLYYYYYCYYSYYYSYYSLKTGIKDTFPRHSGHVQYGRIYTNGRSC